MSLFDSPNTTTIYTVSRLNREIRTLLERGFASLVLTGEVSNFIAPASGHWYFSLKDDKAQIKAAMWRGNNRFAKLTPKNGDQVKVQARVSLYEPRGDYQLIVEHIEPAGEGQLKQQFDALKMQLASEGLFSTAHKKPLPSHINKVGVITSATGAAIKDILTVLKRRAPQLEVIIYPAQVQGEQAHQGLINQLTLANQRNEVDVVIIGRGGGSLEDLWCFNHEQLARAIFASDLAVISAVGHEIDTTISDYVADFRAPTPSAAAELVSPDSEQLQHAILQQKHHLLSLWKQQLATKNQQLQQLANRLALQHPQHQLQQQSQQVDELLMRLQHAAKQQVVQQQKQLDALSLRLERASPRHHLQQAKQQLSQLNTRLHNQMERNVLAHQQQLSQLAVRLDSLSPLSVLGRGYSISRTAQGIVKSIEKLKPNTTLTTRVADGEVISQVTQVFPLPAPTRSS